MYSTTFFFAARNQSLHAVIHTSHECPTLPPYTTVLRVHLVDEYGTTVEHRCVSDITTVDIVLVYRCFDNYSRQDQVVTQ